MNRERWLAIKPLLERALDLDADTRRAWLSELADASPDVARDVQELLAFDAVDREGPLDRPLLLPVPVPDATWAGRAIGAYRLEREIGRGGMGSVWLAHSTDADGRAPVAIKLLNRALLGRAGRERFAREGRVLARLRHPNIARLIDAGLTGDAQPFLVLEYITGTSIDRFADEARYTPAHRIGLFLNVLAAVAHAHANRIVHRDIKPSNILVGDAAVPKLLDFGIAMLLADGRDLAGPSSLSLEGGRPLTPKYAAPEQLRGEPISVATDIYALGVLLYELLSGRHPTSESSDTGAEQMSAVVEVTPMALSQCVMDTSRRSRRDAEALATPRGATPEMLRDAYRGALDGIVARALAKDPRGRQQSVAELASELTSFLNHPANRSSWVARATGLLRRGM